MSNPLVFLIAALFFAAAVSSSLGSQRGLATAAGGYAVGACLIATWWLMRGRARYQANFLNWLVANRDAIKAGKARYNGMFIVEQTEVTQFQLAPSALVISVKTPSRFYVVGEEETVLPSLAFTASSLIVGWWGLPHGPIFTIQAVSSNLRGGERRRVGDLIDELRGHDRVVVQLTERRRRERPAHHVESTNTRLARHYRSKSRESQAPCITASAMTTGRRKTARSGRANPTACP